MSDELDTWVTVWDTQGDSVNVVPGDGPRVDAGVQRYLDSGHTQDSVLDLTTLEGCDFRILASTVTSWLVSTPETRRRAIELQKAQSDETARLKAEVGIWDDE